MAKFERNFFPAVMAVECVMGAVWGIWSGWMGGFMNSLTFRIDTRALAFEGRRHAWCHNLLMKRGTTKEDWDGKRHPVSPLPCLILTLPQCWQDRPDTRSVCRHCTIICAFAIAYTAAELSHSSLCFREISLVSGSSGLVTFTRLLGFALFKHYDNVFLEPH